MENKSIREQVVLLSEIAELSELQAKLLLIKHLTEIKELKHRLAVINEDASWIAKIDEQQNLFEEDSECFTLFNNILIACNLSSDESLSWTLTNTPS